MCSITAFRSDLIKNDNERLNDNERICGDVSISIDVRFLTLHCLFCVFKHENMDIFLCHLRSEHLSLLTVDDLCMESEDKSATEVKQEILEEIEAKSQEDFKFSIEIEDDPLMTEENKEFNVEVVMKNESSNDYDFKDKDYVNDNNDDDDADDDNDGGDDDDDDDDNLYQDKKCLISKNTAHGERPKINVMLKLIELIQEHPSIWDSQLRSLYIRTERQQAIESITEKMQTEFTNHKIDYKYVLARVNRLKQLYFNYNTTQKLTKNEKIFYEKLHFLKGHKPIKEKKKECKLCHLVVTNLAKHMERRHKENDIPQACKICAEIHPSERHLKMHLRSVHKRYECQYCDNAYAALKTLNNHIRREHSDKPQPPMHPKAKLPTERICEYCGRQFGSCANLSTHRRVVHLQLRPYVCSECPKAFKKKDKLKTHINSTHLNLRSHVCEVCSKGFFDRKTLVQHMRLHSDVMNYICKVCGNGFRQAPALHSHMKTHQSRIFDL